MGIQLSAIHLYPVKGARGVTSPQAMVEPQGLQGDRRWVVVDMAGKFISQRTHPRLALVSAFPSPRGVELSGPDHPTVQIGIPAGKDRMDITVWSDQVEASTADPRADQWLTRFLDQPCRLAYMDDSCHRPISSSRGRPGESVSFADGYPLLVISEASLNDLNGRLTKPLPMDRFRPNLVVNGCDPFAEDQWSKISIEGTIFRQAGLCARCSVTTVDQESGVRPSSEPLKTLATYRKSEKGVVFGANLVPENVGTLSVGDNVTILE